jgi:MFS family permease
MLPGVARRLPVIQTPPAEDAEALARPAWQWVLIGGGFTVTLWLPLATLAAWTQNRALIALSFIIAATLSGLLVGRFGPRARLGHVALAGAVGGAMGFMLAILGGGAPPWPLALVAFATLLGSGAAFALLGGYVMRRRRKKQPS